MLQAWMDAIRLVLWTAVVLLIGLLVGSYAAGKLAIRPFEFVSSSENAAADSAAVASARSGMQGDAPGTSPGFQSGTPRARGPGRSGGAADPRGGDSFADSDSPFIDVAQRVLPAVVSVQVRRRFSHPSEGGDGVEEMFVPSSGSGFVFDERGYILTNAHVVRAAAHISVEFDDGRNLDAELVGVDPDTDVAVLRVDPEEPLPQVPLADSDRLRIGDWVAAVGNPHGYLNGSLTGGVVSGKGRNEINIRGGSPTYQDFIQTDASINFGNSGGPLVNRHGRAVGINTAFAGAGTGIGFAIPINLAHEVANELIQTGRVVRGYLGVRLQPLDPELAEAFRLPRDWGVVVRHVEPDTPAETAGLAAGDVIVRFHGEPVEDLPGLLMQVAAADVGESVAIEVLRYGQSHTLFIAPAERPPHPMAGRYSEREDPDREYGLAVTELEEGSELTLPMDAAVLVERVDAGSMADEAGLQTGDLVLEVDGEAVDSVDEFEDLMDRAGVQSRPAVLRVLRGSTSWFLGLRAPSPTSATSR